MLSLSDRARAVTLLALGLIMLLGGPPAMLFDGNRKARLLEELHFQGKKTVASVVQASTPYGENSQVTYTFEARGRRFRKKEDVSSDLLDRARQRRQIEVLYSTADPNVATVDPDRLTRSSERLLSWGPWMIGIVGLLVAALGTYLLRRLN